MSEEYGEQELEAIHQQVGGWFDEFIKSPQYERLTETQRNKASEVIRLFVEYSYNYVGVAPAGWGHILQAGTTLGWAPLPYRGLYLALFLSNSPFPPEVLVETSHALWFKSSSGRPGRGTVAVSCAVPTQRAGDLPLRGGPGPERHGRR